jgi:RNA polymerase primary sigma factor
MKKIDSKTIIISKDSADILKFYYQELRKIKSIPKDEEIKLFFEYRETKCEKIKNLLINNNLRFVLNVSKHYHSGYFYELSDIISSGNIGLIKAIEQFDPYKGFKFSTYAIWWIKQSILDGIGKESKMLKQPIKQHSVNKKYLELKNNFYNKYGFDPNIEDISEELGEITASEIIAKSISAINDNNIFSLSTEINSAENLTFDDILSSSLMDDNKIISDIDLNSINFNKLTKMQKLVLSYLYGFENKPELSLKQIADILNMSEKNVKNILEKAFKTIKNDL